MRFKFGDKIVIHEGFKLDNFKGDYSDVYNVISCFADNIHGVEFVEFYAGGTKYTYPSQAFDLFEKQPEMKKQYSNKQRKLHKLKRINCVLGQQRRHLITVAEGMFLSGKFNIFTVNSYGCNVAAISEGIGKNSAKIQRLRTQIQQSKSLNTSEEKELNEHSSVT